MPLSDRFWIATADTFLFEMYVTWRTVLKFNTAIKLNACSQ